MAVHSGQHCHRRGSTRDDPTRRLPQPATVLPGAHARFHIPHPNHKSLVVRTNSSIATKVSAGCQFAVGFGDNRSLIRSVAI